MKPWQKQVGTQDPNQTRWHRKPTCCHANQREFHAWWVERSSSFVQHNEFLDVLLQPLQQFSFWSDRKEERHVKERSRSDFQWRFTDGGTETNGSNEGETRQLGVTQALEREAQKFILHHWWTYVIWKMLNWRQSTKKYKDRAVLRSGIVNDDSESYAVFTEQGSSASQMTAAKIMDIISRLPGCDGQAADAVSAYTQVKMEDAHKLLKIPKSECPDIWIRLPRYKWPKSWSILEDPVVPLERNLYGHPLAGLLWERQFGKILLKHKFQIGNVVLYIVKKGYSYLCMWMT